MNMTKVTNAQASVTWELTYHCGLLCVMCPFTQLSDAYRVKPQYLDREELIRVAEYLLSFPLDTRITLTGGEPLFSEHFSVVYETLASQQPVNLLSSAIKITEEQFELIEKLPPQSITVSLDGPAKIHDKIRAHKNAFSKTVKNIRRLREICGDNTDFKINCTINSLNIPHLSELYHWCEEEGLPLQLQHLWFLDQQMQIKCFDTIEAEFPVLNKHQFSTSQVDLNLLDKLKQQLQLLEGKVDLLPNVPLSRVDDYYSKPTYFANNSCTKVDNSIRIDPYGNVTPCLGIPFGNLKEHSLEEIYFSSMRQKFLNTIHNGLYTVCSRCCKNSSTNEQSVPMDVIDTIDIREIS